MRAIKGTIIKNRKGISHWEAVLKKWVDLNERYCEMMPGGDAPWLYTERTLTGLMCSAAWQCGCVSIEEFQYQKGYKNSKKRYGRADLYITDENT